MHQLILVVILALSLVILSVHYKIVTIDLKPLYDNADNISIWIIRLLITAILSSLLR